MATRRGILQRIENAPEELPGYVFQSDDTPPLAPFAIVLFPLDPREAKHVAEQRAKANQPGPEGS